MRALLGIGCCLLVAMAGCDDRGATVLIQDARAARTPDGRVAVEVDLVAHERLGGNVGTYCTRVTFAGQVDPAEACAADLEDGDVKTVRLVSDTDLPDGAEIEVRVRHENIDALRTLVVPPRGQS